MKVGDEYYRTIWLNDDAASVSIIDQTRLPHRFVTATLNTVEEAESAISGMLVRGAPLIGATAAWGMFLAMHTEPSDRRLEYAAEYLLKSRPTAVNLRWAVERMAMDLHECAPEDRATRARLLASDICNTDVETCSSIGDHGLGIIAACAADKRPGEPVNILTHCNAGWLATVDWGTALAPIYKAHDAGIPVHVWVDETRPRNQGAHLTAWELGGHGVAHTLVVDNAGGHLMQRGLVDACIVGTDRTTGSGDVCNKIGTYLKALAARDNDVPFYVAAPSTSIDWSMRDGLAEIPIEQRDAAEIFDVVGLDDNRELRGVRICPAATPVRNDAFDVTPAKYVTGLITERGVCAASAAALRRLYPELAPAESAVG